MSIILHYLKNLGVLSLSKQSKKSFNYLEVLTKLITFESTINNERVFRVPDITCLKI